VAGDPAVHGDHQVGPAGEDPPGGLARQAVAVGQPAGDEGLHPAAQQPQQPGQDRRGGQAVGVGVAVDQHALPSGHRGQQARHRLAHVGQQLRRMDVLESGVQEAPGGAGVLQAAVDQQLGGDRGDAQRLGKLAAPGGRRGAQLPAEATGGDGHALLRPSSGVLWPPRSPLGASGANPNRSGRRVQEQSRGQGRFPRRGSGRPRF